MNEREGGPSGSVAEQRRRIIKLTALDMYRVIVSRHLADIGRQSPGSTFPRLFGCLSSTMCNKERA